MTAGDKKKLLIVLAALAAVVVLYRTVDGLFISPGLRLQGEIEVLDSNIRKLDQENSRIAGINRRLAGYYARTFSTDESKAGEEMRARLMELLAPCGLSTEQLNSSAVSPRMIASGAKSKDKEISRTVTINGAKLSHVVNLLYLLETETHLHRMESLSLTPVSDGKINLQLKYATLTMEPPKSGLKATTSSSTEPAGSLDTPQREMFEMISIRDMFRPYVPRPLVAKVEPTRTPDPEPPTPRISESQDSRLRVTGLPTLFGKDYIYVLNTANSETRTYKPGDQWGDAKIVMVDCRPMAHRGNPKDISDSRVILKLGQDFWAVEIGDTLADKHRLPSADLPPQLMKTLIKAPTTQVAAPVQAPSATMPATAPSAGGESAVKNAAN